MLVIGFFATRIKEEPAIKPSRGGGGGGGTWLRSR